MSSQTPAVADWVNPDVMNADPYPSYDRLRDAGSVCWVPAFNRYLVTSFSGCLFIEQHPEIFTSNVSGSTMTRALGGHPMLRKDDPEHAVERQALNPTLRPKRMEEVWAKVFSRNAERYIEQLLEIGPDDADLNRDFAAPYASKNLIDILGMGDDVAVEDCRRWSLDFIAGVGNVLDDPEIWSRCEASRAEVETLLDERIPFLRRHPDDSLLSLMIEADLAEEIIRSNFKLAISGGMNEPQHAITNTVWALDQHSEVKQRAKSDDRLWAVIFDETMRWQSPIGMFPRETLKPAEIDGRHVPAGASIGVVIAAANRDPNRFAQPERFDPDRKMQSHLAFGSGAHMCAGRWAAKSAIGTVGIPALYRRIPDLRVDKSREVEWFGWVFRGITHLPVTWD